VSQTRRLAAILAADVAGYSRPMGADEEGTLAVLKALRRELVDSKIAEDHGRIVKTTGDGMLVEFADALNSAIRFARGRECADLDSDEMLLFATVRAAEIAVTPRAWPRRDVSSPISASPANAAETAPIPTASPGCWRAIGRRQRRLLGKR
jgi:class 3 adenylate cyclase